MDWLVGVHVIVPREWRPEGGIRGEEQHAVPASLHLFERFVMEEHASCPLSEVGGSVNTRCVLCMEGEC